MKQSQIIMPGILETGGGKPFLGLEIDNMGLFGGGRFSGGFILNIYLFWAFFFQCKDKTIPKGS